MTDSTPRPATETRIRRATWFPTTRTGKVALALAYLAVLSPFWALVVLGPAVFRAGASDDVVVAMLTVSVISLWAALLWAKEPSLLVAVFTLVLSTVLMYFLWWVTTVPGGMDG